MIRTRKICVGCDRYFEKPGVFCHACYNWLLINNHKDKSFEDRISLRKAFMENKRNKYKKSLQSSIKRELQILITDVSSTEQYKCSKCGEIRVIEDFYIKSNGRPQARCKICQIEVSKKCNREAKLKREEFIRNGEQAFCECGCGALLKDPGKRFIKGQHLIGRIWSSEELQRRGTNIRIGYAFSKLDQLSSPSFCYCGEEKPAHRNFCSSCAYDYWSLKDRKEISQKKKIWWKKNGHKYLRDNHWCWNGGASLKGYCFEFTADLKEVIKHRDGYKCQNPNCWGTSSRLSIHHIDYDKKNCVLDNLITLCASCNSRANTNRGYWEELYSVMIP